MNDTSNMADPTSAAVITARRFAARAEAAIADLEERVPAGIGPLERALAERLRAGALRGGTPRGHASANSRTCARGNETAEVATLPARPGQGRTRDLIAELAGTSSRTAQDVITTYDHDPQLYERVLRGERKANTAAEEVRQTLRDAELAASPPPLPEGPFELIYADPPWRLPGSPTNSRAVERHYPTMPLEEIKAIGVPASDNSLLFLWGVNSMTPETLEVLSAWGFDYVTNFAWCKDRFGLGHYNRSQHELLHLGRRGAFSPPPPRRRPSSVIDARRGRHSEKPASVCELIETMYPHASKLELFARGRPRPGWSAWGNQCETAGTAS